MAGIPAQDGAEADALREALRREDIEDHRFLHECVIGHYQKRLEDCKLPDCLQCKDARILMAHYQKRLEEGPRHLTSDAVRAEQESAAFNERFDRIMSSIERACKGWPKICASDSSIAEDPATQSIKNSPRDGDSNNTADLQRAAE